MTYQQTLDYLFSQLPMFQRVGAAAFKKDLSNTLALCKHLGNPEKSYPTIHVAGTNGKGSSSHILAGILQAHGLKVGLYTSPHYKDFRERVKVNGSFISKKEVVEFVEKNKVAFESIQPSFFEWTVALAFHHFKNKKVDLAVIEVGLGGRLDSTNVILPLIGLITNIGYDHMQFLGETLPEIAFEKAGIIKAKIPVVIGEKHPETEPVFKKIAAERKAPIYFAVEELRCEVVAREQLHTVYHFYKKDKLWLENVRVNLTGSYQQKNLVSALETLLILEKEGKIPTLDESKMRYALENLRSLTTMMGRWEVLSETPYIIADSAHNKEGLDYAMKQLKEIPKKNLHMVIGAVNDKDLQKMLALMPIDARYYFAKPNIPRGLAAGELKKLGNEVGLKGKTYSSVRKALAAAKVSAKEGDVIYVGGSTFVVAEVL
ncbi:MAG: folylpolyglutamate synthase/dihydrofolate synthase family protein [Saprospiraceae bacterium]